MIAREWSARATDAGTLSYHRYFEGTLLPQLRKLPGFRGAYLLARDVGDVVEVATQTFWDSEEAIRGFAGDDISSAVVEQEARALLRDFDRTVVHRTVLVDGRS